MTAGAITVRSFSGSGSDSPVFGHHACDDDDPCEHEDDAFDDVEQSRAKDRQRIFFVHFPGPFRI